MDGGNEPDEAFYETRVRGRLDERRRVLMTEAG